MPKISIIIPVYNVEKYIEKCLNSVLNQTLEDIEIIIVNDGSKDESKKIIENKIKEYPNKIKYYEKENGGLSDARNYGLNYANGDYIAFLDSDDYVSLDCYEQMYNEAIKNNSDMVECDFYWKYPQKEKIDIGYRYKNKKEMLTYGRVVAWNKLYKKSVIEKALKENIKFPKGLRYEDVEFFYKIIPYLNKVNYVDKPLIYYVQRENSISNVQNEKTKEIYYILENVINYYKKKNIYKDYKNELEYICARYILCSSFLRVIKIPDKDIRKKVLQQGLNMLKRLFPNWKKNKILNDLSIEKNKKIYMKTINGITIKIYSLIFRLKR